MKVSAVIDDLLLYSRIESAASAAGASLERVDDPSMLPPARELDLVLVDWSARRPGWAETLGTWRSGADGTRVILFGPHTDLEAHRAARDAGLGPMWARSKLLTQLRTVLARV